MFIKQVLTIVALATAATSGAALAQEKPVTFSSEIQLVSVNVDNGMASEKLVSPDKVIPGDALLFTNSFRNNTTQSITNFTIVNPVPDNMVLSAESAADVDVSVDGGENFGAIVDLSITDEETGAARAATPADVTHLRWVVSSLPAGQEGSVQYRASVR